MLISEDLYKSVLLEPLDDKVDQLLIVSGYATAAMAFYHLNEVGEKIRRIKLLIGMCAEEGMSLSNHKGLVKLMDVDYKGKFECSYILGKPAVHSKLYIWNNQDSDNMCFVGSANYTQNAFLGRKREILALCEYESAIDYFHKLESESIFCNLPDAEDAIRIYNDREYFRRKEYVSSESEDGPKEIQVPDTEGLRKVTVCLLTATGEIHQRGGLNWGQRSGRNPNQVYIPLNVEVQRSGFFPNRPIHFTVLTDDGKIFTCTRAQANGKAIETPNNNSELGEYFRRRMGLNLGVFVRKEDLIAYGRTDVDFYKIDEETYYMDFSVD